MKSNLDRLAREIIAHEKDTSADAAHAVDSAVSKLHDAMVSLVGTAGYSALLRRAIHLTKPQHAWLGHLVVAKPFALEQLGAQAAIVGEARTLEGAASLVSSLLYLLCTFIGEPLTLRQVSQVWTNISTVRKGSNGTKETQ